MFRPTKFDGTTTELSYGGCGCAGGVVTTARDQRGRLKKSYLDVLGRLSKVEELNYDSSVYSTAVYEYNRRGQIDNIKHYQGSGGTPQVRTFGYDGFGRLTSRSTPEQGTTTYGYFADDTLNWMTDARGATATYAYTARHLVSSITYNTSNLVPGQYVESTTDVSFAYDAAGNRTQMTDSQGTANYHYDSLSRMDWESRTFAGLPGTFTLNYGYNNAGLASVTNPSQLGSSRVDYNIDHTGATASVTGSGQWSPATYVQGMQYRAFGGVKAATYGNGRTLSATYTNMLRLDTWGVSGVTGWKYYYSDFGENTGRVTYAQNTFNAEPGRPAAADPTLDHSYDYDQVGRLSASYTGTEARAHTGRPGGAWGVYDGPYSQAYIKDAWGNVTQKLGRAGDPDQFTASYTNNRRDGFSYDAAGNLTFDLGQHFTYDATGQQVYVDWPNLYQWYDGDRLRVKKTEGGANTPTYYLRSSVLGGQVVAEINGSGSLQRGYVYGGGGALLAILSGGVSWVYQDGATKSQRIADSDGNVYAGVDVDPWGREMTARSWNSQVQPRRFTTYTRDSNDSDEAAMRRYNRWQLRFDQPDPTDESYDLTDPQSFNRYAYVNNDPVNLIDPSGLMAKQPDATQGWWYYGNGFWGYSEGRGRTLIFGHIFTDPNEREWFWGGVFTWEPWSAFGGSRGGRRGGGSGFKKASKEDCENKAKEIESIANAVQQRGEELEQDPNNFVQNGDWDQIKTHNKSFDQRQSQLNEKIDWYDKNCKGGPPLSDGVREWAKKPRPVRTRPFERRGIQMEERRPVSTWQRINAWLYETFGPNPFLNSRPGVAPPPLPPPVFAVP
ncbi:MAG: RHS repeat-associated core domain-containing protein [Pyrinomonadaceae bacterium]